MSSCNLQARLRLRCSLLVARQCIKYKTLMCWHYITSIVGPRVILFKNACFCPRIVFLLSFLANSADRDGMSSWGISSESKLFIEVVIKIKLLALDSHESVFFIIKYFLIISAKAYDQGTRKYYLTVRWFF